MCDFHGFFFCVLLHSLGYLALGGAVSASLLFIHVAVVPLVFKYSKFFRRNLIFANAVQWPPFLNYENLRARGIEGGRNLSIEFFSKVDRCPVKLGVWHILPNSAKSKLKGVLECGDKETLQRQMDEELANTKSPIILYLHGNSHSRAAYHRIELYKFFQRMEFHTVAFDYRGHGNSTNIRPSEDGVVEDSLMVYEWIHNSVSKSGHNTPIFVWGHSLGTGISSHMIGRMDELSASLLQRQISLPLPNGLILEAPFNSIADEVAHHPMSRLVTWLPYYESCFVAPFRYCPKHSFRSAAHLSRVRNEPVMILHAEDDVIVPLTVGTKLYKAILESRSEGGAPVVMHVYDRAERLGHRFICRAKDLHVVVGDFVENHR